MARRSAIQNAGGRGTEVSAAWRREHAGSGLTSRMILAYVEREAGGQAAKQMLARAGLLDAEDSLRNENHWFSYDTKLALWSAAEEVLGDPDVAEHVGAAALDLSVAIGLKRALRALGTPGFVYLNVVRANAKFNWAHQLDVLDRGPGRVRMRYTDIAGVGYHRYDCAYTKGLLATVPQLFGLPPARVTHRVCGADGDPWCDFDVRWSTGTQALKRAAFALAAAGTTLTGVAALAQPAFVPAVIGVLAAGELTIGAQATRFTHRRLRVLEQRVREQDDAAQRLLSSLDDLSSDLRLDEVLDQITTKAQTAVGGKEFVLLLADGPWMHADRHSGIPASSLAALESWAAKHRQTLLERGAVVLDDLASEPALALLAREEQIPLGSMCAAPLVFRDGLLGVLVALAHGSTVFLPGDAAALSAYAAHGAIALSNAHLVERLEHQAAADPLTGLANQRAFRGDCAAAFSRAQRAGSEVSMIMLDLDEFKAINDTHGHPYGDQMLIAVADSLSASIRAHDTVARMGGEEFAILLPDTDADAAYEVAERARDAVAKVPSARAPLTCSAGVATASAAEASPADLLELADGALYRAKHLGRDRTVVSHADSRSSSIA